MIYPRIRLRTDLARQVNAANERTGQWPDWMRQVAQPRSEDHLLMTDYELSQDNDPRLVAGAYVSRDTCLYRVNGPTDGDHTGWTQWEIENCVCYGIDSNGEPMHATSTVSTKMLTTEYKLERESRIVEVSGCEATCPSGAAT